MGPLSRASLPKIGLGPGLLTQTSVPWSELYSTLHYSSADEDIAFHHTNPFSLRPDPDRGVVVIDRIALSRPIWTGRQIDGKIVIIIRYRQVDQKIRYRQVIRFPQSFSFLTYSSDSLCSGSCRYATLASLHSLIYFAFRHRPTIFNSNHLMGGNVTQVNAIATQAPISAP